MPFTAIGTASDLQPDTAESRYRYDSGEDDLSGEASASQSAEEKLAAFLALSRKRWLTSQAATSRLREEMRTDQKFASGNGNQWTAGDRSARANEGRPCLEINRIPQFLRQVGNQTRANRSQILIHPRAGEATVDIASAIQGLIRSVEVESDSDIAYDTATDNQLRNGLGFVRVLAEWSKTKSWEQVCRIARVPNPLACFWDPTIQDGLWADMRWMHIIQAFGKDDYDDRWGDISPYASLTEYATTTQGVSDWTPEGKVIVAEYFTVSHERRTLVQLSTGEALWAEEFDHFMEMWAATRPGEPFPQIAKQREAQVPTVRWCIHNGIDILEGNEDRTNGRVLPGTRIPIFPVIGDEINIDGDVDIRGMVRDGRDPQRMYNYWSSSIAEAVSLAPKSPWVAVKGQVENYMDMWKDANRKAYSVLFYDAVSIDGHLAPAPQRNVVEPAIQAMVQGLMESDRDLKAVMGLYEPSLGERRSQGESGKAILAQQQQGMIANSNFFDNLQRTRRAVGRCLLEWIPVIYDVPRVLHLVKPDGRKASVVVYAGPENKPQENEFPAQITEIYDVGVGDFDVTVDTGPSYQTERQATEAWLLDLVKAVPGLAEIGLDLILENSDHEVGQQLAQRAKLAMNPKYQDKADPKAQVPMLMAQVQQLSGLLEKAHEAITRMGAALNTKELDNQTKKEVAMIQAQAQLAMAAAKLGSERDIVAFQAEFERYQQMVDGIQQRVLTEGAQVHDRTMAAEAAAQASQPPAQGAPA